MSKEPRFYTIVKGDDSDSLAVSVREHMEIGYEPVGGLAVAAVVLDGVAIDIYFQAMLGPAET